MLSTCTHSVCTHINTPARNCPGSLKAEVLAGFVAGPDADERTDGAEQKAPTAKVCQAGKRLVVKQVAEAAADNSADRDADKNH